VRSWGSRPDRNVPARAYTPDMVIRLCLHCGGPIGQDKRPHAVYCSRKCKTAASDLRRRDDGRAAARWEAWSEDTKKKGPRPYRPQKAVRRSPGYYQARYVRQREWRVQAARDNYARNPERSRAYSRKWRRENREKRQLQHANRRARKYNNPGYIRVTVKDWHDALRIAGHACIYCGGPGPFVMEHIIPLVRGGRHAPANIAPACIGCNSSKSDRFVSEWRHGRLPPLRR
jgi:5-methylcytosine-specific restriction endonuclease McrA/endogenous inhibitor of DNA gyrase (YacG/DUF329 family)